MQTLSAPFALHRLTFVTELTPDAVDSLVVSIISDVYAKSAGVVSVAAVTTLWSAAKGFSPHKWKMPMKTRSITLPKILPPESDM